MLKLKKYIEPDFTAPAFQNASEAVLKPVEKDTVTEPPLHYYIF